MSCPCTFPDAVSLECGVELGKLVLARKLVEKRGTATKHAACLLGSIGNVIGDASDDDELPVVGSGPELTAEEIAECDCDFDNLDECCEFVVDQVPANSGVPVATMNPLLAFALRKLLEKVLPLILNGEES